MNKKQAIEDTIKHWKRMIRWAKKQKPRDRALWQTMNDSIEETWQGDDCPLCKAYICEKCPLEKMYGECSGFNKKNLWETVNHSRTWGTWVKNAEKFLIQLTKLK